MEEAPGSYEDLYEKGREMGFGDDQGVLFRSVNISSSLWQYWMG
jgi:hypothetical protein